MHLSRDRETFAQSDPVLAPEVCTVAGQREWIANLLRSYHDGHAWPGVIQAGDEIVGQITVNSIYGSPHYKGMLGYWVATAAQGQGHATRAVRAVLRRMSDELGLHRAEASTLAANQASECVLRANGFQLYGLAREHIFVAGRWQDGLLWELVLD